MMTCNADHGRENKGVAGVARVSMLRLFLLFLVLIVSTTNLGACSGEPQEQPDGSADGDADADGDPGFEPAPPEPPLLTPCPAGWLEVPPPETGGVATCDPWPESGPVAVTSCPEGWRLVEVEGFAFCDPWPEGGPRDCPPGAAHFPGEADCTRIGSECPAGSWADDLPGDREVLYVLAAAPEGGVGTRESPFGSIAEALAVASEPGSYLELNDVHVSDTWSNHVGDRGWVLSVEDGADAALLRAVFRRNRHLGVFAADGGTVLRLSDPVVRDVQPEPATNTSPHRPWT